MKMNFESLCQLLGIDAGKAAQENLALLKPWFHLHISSDIQFIGDPSSQFEKCKQFTMAYLDNFYSAMPAGKQQVGPELQSEHSIFSAASAGFDRAILALNADKALLNSINSFGMTPLHVAALKGHVNTLRTLLALEADKNIMNQQQQFPLFSALALPAAHDDALKIKKVEIFNLLKSEDKRYLYHQNNGDTVLHQMATHNFNGLMEDILTSNRDLAYIHNNHFQYPLHSAILNNQTHSALLLLKIADAASLLDSNGWGALHYAARYGNIEMLGHCCTIGANIDATDKMGKTPLMLAAELARLDIIKELVQRNAQIDLTDEKGFTALHYAVLSGDATVVQWLLENTDIDPDTENLYNQTASDLSQAKGYDEITALLLALEQKSSFKR